MKIKLAAFVLLVAAACSGKKEHQDQDQWNELDSFHKIMAEVYHPLDSGNLEPAKRLASQLAAEAERLSAAPLPEKVNNEKMKKDIELLKTVSRTLADQVKNGSSDDIVKETLEGAHQQFHKIMEAWVGGHHNEGKHEEDEHEEDEDHDED